MARICEELRDFQAQAFPVMSERGSLWIGGQGP